MVIWTRDALPATPFAGSFYSQRRHWPRWRCPSCCFCACPRRQKQAIAGTAHPLKAIAATPQFIEAAAAGVVSYGLTAFLMTAAPMAMVGCGHSVRRGPPWGIQWHVLAMFGPSFFTGRLIGRFGQRKITALGLVMIAAWGLLALMGEGLSEFWGSLILLGVGGVLASLGPRPCLPPATPRPSAPRRRR